MKAKIINESLRDKLIGPTKESIDIQFNDKYSKEIIDYVSEIISNCDNFYHNRYYHYIIDDGFYFEYEPINASIKIYRRFMHDLDNRFDYNNADIYALLKYLIIKILKIKVNEVYHI